MGQKQTFTTFHSGAQAVQPGKAAGDALIAAAMEELDSQKGKGDGGDDDDDARSLLKRIERRQTDSAQREAKILRRMLDYSYIEYEMFSAYNSVDCAIEEIKKWKSAQSYIGIKVDYEMIFYLNVKQKKIN